MKKVLKYIIFMFIFVPFISVQAVSSDSVEYSVKKYYINSEIEIAGGLAVEELIEVDGTYNGYYREISTKNTSTVEFTGLESDLKGSSIYNPTSVVNLRVGMLKNKENVNFNTLTSEELEENIEYFELVETASSGDTGVFTFEEKDGIYTVRMYNETIDSNTIFYLSYVVTNILVEHNDSAEFYYTLISKEWADPIDDVKVFVALPYPSEKLFKVWAHGQLNGEVLKDTENRGVMASIQNYLPGYGFDIRTLFDLDLFQININESKKSKLDAVPIIERIEQERANEANEIRKFNKIKYYGIYAISGLYIVGIIFLFVYAYIKHDKEYKSNFNDKYNREFINDYDVELIEYLMNKNITTTGFSTSILNLIYKKKIDVEVIQGKKKTDHKLTLKSEDGVSTSEKIIIDLLFKTIGNGKEVLLSEVKKEANNTTSSGKNSVYDEFNAWKLNTTAEAKKQNFYEDNTKTRLAFGGYALIGAAIFFLDNFFVMTPIRFVVLILAILFLIYIISFNKRTVKGNEDYNKWNAFKNFLNDFGRFEEKELPEIKLWERYLVYASIFGLADKVRKTMKIKFEEIRPNYEMRDTMFDYYVFTNLTRDISTSIDNSIITARASVQSIAESNYSSGSGGGGGFSSGGGFGGGGNSGGGF